MRRDSASHLNENFSRKAFSRLESQRDISVAVVARQQQQRLRARGLAGHPRGRRARSETPAPL